MDPDYKDEQERKRESGEPGGGQGRKDEVGHSGVYPMSGPHPPGHAEIKGQASWGQGERGAAGYEDHGGSELTYEGGQLLGGLNLGPGGEPQPQPPPTAADSEIAHSEWPQFLDSFSRQHKDWIVHVEVISPTGRLVIVEDRPLEGISLDSVDGNERAYVQVTGGGAEHVTHTITQPIRIVFKQTQQGRHQGLEIRSADGTTTAISFRAAMSPEMLDGMAA